MGSPRSPIHPSPILISFPLPPFLFPKQTECGQKCSLGNLYPFWDERREDSCFYSILSNWSLLYLSVMRYLWFFLISFPTLVPFIFLMLSLEKRYRKDKQADAMRLTCSYSPIRRQRWSFDDCRIESSFC